MSKNRVAIVLSLIVASAIFSGDSRSQSNDPKRWTARITQSGENPPTVSVLENTLGGNVSWSRISEGVYFGELSGAFPQTRTVILNGKQTWFDGGPSDGRSAFLFSSSSHQPDNLILVTQRVDLQYPTSFEADDVLNDANGITVQVVVYPE
jgi:hypothetical protein